MKCNRREALTAMAAGFVAMNSTAAVAAVSGLSRTPRAGVRSDDPHSLPPLPYAASALEPHIDAQTSRFITRAIIRPTWTV